MTNINQSDPRPLVVVPVHRSIPTADESFSLQRCSMVLAKHPIQIIHPKGLDLTFYLELMPTAIPKPVPAAWMASIRAYNRMMLNPAFYAMFEGFSHLLIHEPDSLVLTDELLLWCRKPFSYIGAPWFENFDIATPESQIIGVGNSGFCLISVKAITELFRSKYRWLNRSWILRQLIDKSLGRKVCYSGLFLIQSLGERGSIASAYMTTNENFDSFLCRRIKPERTNFQVAPVKEALRFAWEVNPSICERLNGCRLPFGIHAWARYDRATVERLLNSVPEALS